MRRSNFPYTQVAVNQRRRRSIAPYLTHTKPVLINEQLNATSPLVIAMSAITLRLIELSRTPDKLRVLNRRQFEEVVAEIFDGFGYSVELTAQTRDGGRDIIAIGRQHDIQAKYLIECKRPDPGNPIGVSYVRQLLGVVEDEKATKGILVATTTFTSDARAFEERNQWRLELKEYEQILGWIENYITLKGL